jgi:glycosyltransferase involved in cell wall biosynthesis
MRILMVTPYPPIPDGIANYAVQEVIALVEAGHDVEVLSPYPSAAHHNLALRSRRGPFALAKRVSRYDRVIIQFHPDIFYPPNVTERDRLVVTGGLVAAFGRARNVEVRLHELNFAWGREKGLFGTLFRRLWKLPAKITVHTEHERSQFVHAVGLSPDRVEVTDHGRHFVRRTALSRAEARDRLELDQSAFMFLCIGFVQPHKGFDRAVQAFSGLGDHGCRLDIVGSVRTDEPHFIEYTTNLRQMAKQTRGAHLHEGYVSDELFDVWVRAADVLLLPYRHIFSSSVLERAALYGTTVIATRVGGLEGQRREEVRLVDDDDELASAMREAAGITAEAARLEAWPVVSETGPDRAAIMAAIRRRATELHPERAVRTIVDSTSEHRSPLRTMPYLSVPTPRGRNALVRGMQSLVRRATAWEIDPIIHQVNNLHQRTTVSLEGSASDEKATTEE